jgi:3alpha(or 20beta)-hydroxysteroid dehydrogenase
MQRLSGRVALVTGAAGAIGAAVAARLVAEGARVILADIREDAGRTVAADLDPERAAFVKLDVRDPQAWASAVVMAERTFAPVTVLVNNAGTTSVGPLETLSAGELSDLNAVNHYAVVYGMQAVFPGMRDAGGGSIVNISSISACFGVGYNAGYAGAKAATHAIGKAAAVEWAAHRIRVNAVVAGAIDTPMSNGGQYGALGNLAARVAAQVPLARAGTVEEITALIAFLASDEAAFCTGADFVIDGGQTAGRLRQLAR